MNDGDAELCVAAVFLIGVQWMLIAREISESSDFLVGKSVGICQNNITYFDIFVVKVDESFTWFGLHDKCLERSNLK